MKNTKRAFFILAILVSLVAVHSAFATTTVTVAGVVTATTVRPNSITIDDSGVATQVFGIRFNYLANQYNIVVEEGISVSVEAYEYVCASGAIRLMASSITVGDVTVVLRPVP